MDTLRRLVRLTGVELLKYRSKRVAWLALGLLFATPILAELLLAGISRHDAVLPNATHLLFSGDMLLFIAVTVIVVSLMTLGGDYELGTVRTILSRGAERYQFILAKVLATGVAELANGLAYVMSALLSSVVTHCLLSDVPLADAAGEGLVWRALGCGCVIGLTGFAFSGVVMLALVLGRSAWPGMLAGLGGFIGDYYLGGVGPFRVLGVQRVYRYTVSYHALGLVEQFFPSNPATSMPRAWWGEGAADPARAVVVLLLYGSLFILAAVLIFRRQDLLARR